MNFSILAAGNIASQMAATVTKMPEINCHAVAARDINRAESFCSKFGFKKSFGSYEELFEDVDTDIIYVASPHSHHYEHAKAALLHHKHVLCEKPACVNAAQLRELYTIAKENNVVFADATWTRYMPFVAKLRQIIADGVIGDASFLDCSMGFCSSNIPRMASPATAGGALMDLGIYPLTMALIVFGDTAANISGACTKTELGVDSQNAFTLCFENGKIATLRSSMIAKMNNIAVIYGTKGRIELQKDFWKCQGFTIFTQDATEDVSLPHEISGFEYEVRSLLASISANKSECDELPMTESIRVLEYMDALRKSWDMVFPCE